MASRAVCAPDDNEPPFMRQKFLTEERVDDEPQQTDDVDSQETIDVKSQVTDDDDSQVTDDDDSQVTDDDDSQETDADFHAVAEPESNPVPEANLKEDVRCRKNPGHKDFIPIKEFELNHLQTSHRVPGMVAFVQAMGALTVWLKARVVSEARPEHYPRTERPYPFHIPGGGELTRTGSGYVWDVDKHGEEGEEWWEVDIVTARHVIYDSAELRKCDVKYFFDSGSEYSPENKSNEGKGMEVWHTYMEGDNCVFTMRVDDKEVGERLEKAWEDYLKLREELPVEELRDLVIVTSHPHGCAKHVTVGELVESGEIVFDPITYTAGTCPGSSGGFVWWGGERDPVTDVWDDLRWQRFPHSGGLPGKGNRSGWGGL